MSYQKAALANQLQPGGKLKVTLEGKTLLLTNVDGAYYAIDNKCPHRGGSLFDGTLSGDTITCPLHKNRIQRQNRPGSRKRQNRDDPP